MVGPTTNMKLVLLQLQFNTFTMWKGCAESYGPRALLIYYLFALMRKSIMSSQSPVYQKASDCSSLFWERISKVLILIATMLEYDLINIHFIIKREDKYPLQAKWFNYWVLVFINPFFKMVAWLLIFPNIGW